MKPLETLDDRLALAGNYAKKYGISAALICAVIEQESNWNTWAYRYEPMFYDRYILPLQISEYVGRFRATSWGLMQIMGQTARELGFVGEFFSELCDPDTGVDWGCQKLKKCLDDSAGDEMKALLRWNGGGAPGYAAEVLARKGKY